MPSGPDSRHLKRLGDYAIHRVISVPPATRALVTTSLLATAVLLVAAYARRGTHAM